MIDLPDPTTILPLGLAFIRVGAVLSLVPIIGDQPTPVRVRILLAAAITMLLAPTIKADWSPNFAVDPLVIASYIFREIIIGVTIGYFSRVAFDGLMMAASVVGYQMGFTTAGLFLPDYSERLDGFSSFHRMIIMLIFLSLGLHHVFISAIVETFRVIPGGGGHLNPALGPLVIQLTSGLLRIAVQLAAPVLVALMFTMAAVGIASRTVPNLNGFMMSFPASFCVGLLIYLATLPIYPDWMRQHFDDIRELISGAIQALATA